MPPGAAGGHSERTAVFQSALEQAEQLAKAATDVGYAARPLLLYYALNQAGRAVAAARIDGPAWRVEGHGLSEVRSEPPTPLSRRTFKPAPKTSAARRDAFHAVSEVTGSGLLSRPVALGEVWMAIPELLPPPVHQLKDLDSDWRRPLVVFDADWNVDDQDRFGLSPYTPLWLLVANMPPGLSAEQIETYLLRYPTATGAHPRGSGGGLSPHGQQCIEIAWSTPRREGPSIDDAAPINRYQGARLLMPTIGNGDSLSPLMLWWILLFGLSTIARYDPELWIAALAINDSTDATALETTLDIAAELLPTLIIQALHP